MLKHDLMRDFLEEGKGVIRLKPTWVPRAFCRPGKRLKLHPDDYYRLGLARGGIDERWLSSTVRADNGADTPEDEGLSYAVSMRGTERILLKDMIDTLGEEMLGGEVMREFGGWTTLGKFFDNEGPLPFHIHHNEIYAARVGAKQKPEMYFYPSQMNNHGGEFPFTFFGINPGVTKEQVKKALTDFPKGDNKILDLSAAYKLTLDTGWDVPPGVLHAPGSLCTYEPQYASDVYAMYQSMLYGEHAVSEDLLWANCPVEELNNFDYLIEVIDWELNTDLEFVKNRFMRPVVITRNEDYTEEWICYKSKYVSAKRLTVNPGSSAVIKDGSPYGLIALQGHGRFGCWDIESPTLIRYGELTNDEFFVTYGAASEGVRIINESKSEPLVILKHFAGNEALK